MKESIIIGVIGKGADGEPSEDDIELQFVYSKNDGIVYIHLDGKKIAVCDWEDNLKIAFQRALEVWK